MKDMKVFDDYEVKELDGQAKVCLNALRKYYEGVRIVLIFIVLV